MPFIFFGQLLVFYHFGHTSTFCSSFDELLELSQQGDNSKVDMLVGDIYGGMDYSKVLHILHSLLSYPFRENGRNLKSNLIVRTENYIPTLFFTTQTAWMRKSYLI